MSAPSFGDTMFRSFDPNFPGRGDITVVEMAWLWSQLGLPTKLLARTEFWQNLPRDMKMALVRSYVWFTEIL